MQIDLLIAEIGSTTTVVNAFDKINEVNGEISFLCQGVYKTTVDEGDVNIGLCGAIADLEKKLGEKVEYKEMMASSSAAGGLKMSVFGLVSEMTVKAAKAAALGAGAIVCQTAAGKLNEYDIDELYEINPNIILLAGGTDYGERETSIYNAKLLIERGVRVPVIYAGNVQNQRMIKGLFDSAGIACYITENVYPKLDLLNIEPTRRIIHKCFEEHITQARGMSKVRELVNGSIIPTPGAVMEAAQLLYKDMSDLVVIDIGGATSDVHSVCKGSEAIAILQTTPEPFAKRTVEGDLGLYVNAGHVIDLIGEDKLSNSLGFSVSEERKSLRPIPETENQIALARELCRKAGKTSLLRHAGEYRYIYSPSGRQTIVEGKDLTTVKHVIGTGGALTRLSGHEELLRAIADMNESKTMLFPRPGEAKVLFDNDYIFASAGVMSKKYPNAALSVLKKSMERQ